MNESFNEMSLEERHQFVTFYPFLQKVPQQFLSESHQFITHHFSDLLDTTVLRITANLQFRVSRRENEAYYRCIRQGGKPKHPIYSGTVKVFRGPGQVLAAFILDLSRCRLQKEAVWMMWTDFTRDSEGYISIHAVMARSGEERIFRYSTAAVKLEVNGVLRNVKLMLLYKVFATELKEYTQLRMKDTRRTLARSMPASHALKQGSLATRMVKQLTLTSATTPQRMRGRDRQASRDAHRGEKTPSPEKAHLHADIVKRALRELSEYLDSLIAN